MNTVSVVVTGDQTGDYYWARSYPSRDRNKNNKDDYYSVPVYHLRIEQYDSKGTVTDVKYWTGLRFMPFYNDPKAPHTDYKARGFLVAGLSSPRRGRVLRYNRHYGVHNTYSPYGGAIVIKGAFYIHAGPEQLGNAGWGSAGCVEVIGNFDEYKKDIATLGGISGNADDAIEALVKSKKLYYDYKAATPPKLTIKQGT